MTQPVSQYQLRGSHTIKREHTKTSLETLGTTLEKLINKAEASKKELEQQRGKLRPTGSTATSERISLSLPEPHQVTRAEVSGSTNHLRVTPPLVTGSPETT
jgi:hypothetical protein